MQMYIYIYMNVYIIKLVRRILDGHNFAFSFATQNVIYENWVAVNKNCLLNFEFLHLGQNNSSFMCVCFFSLCSYLWAAIAVYVGCYVECFRCICDVYSWQVIIFIELVTLAHLLLPIDLDVTLNPSCSEQSSLFECLSTYLTKTRKRNSSTSWS